MSILQRTSDLTQSKLNNFKGFTKDNSLIHKCHLNEENLITSDYFTTFKTHTSKNTNSFSLSQKVTDYKTTFTSSENKTDTTFKEPTEPQNHQTPTAPNQLESLIEIMKEKVTKKMKEELTNQCRLFKNKSQNLSQFELTLNTSKSDLEESIHTVHSLYQDSTKKFYEKVRLNKENTLNNIEYEQMKTSNEKMEKDIAELDRDTRNKKMDLFCIKKELQSAYKRSKEMSQLVYNQIEDNKSLKSALLKTLLKVDKMKEVMYKYNKQESNIAEEIKIIIKNYS